MLHITVIGFQFDAWRQHQDNATTTIGANGFSVICTGIFTESMGGNVVIKDNAKCI